MPTTVKGPITIRAGEELPDKLKDAIKGTIRVPFKAKNFKCSGEKELSEFGKKVLAAIKK